jgi:hypothetical protein
LVEKDGEERFCPKDRLAFVKLPLAAEQSRQCNGAARSNATSEAILNFSPLVKGS